MQILFPLRKRGSEELRRCGIGSLFVTRSENLDPNGTPGVTDRDYYANSNHVPVYYKCSARHKAEVEAPYHDLSRGGHIFYVEIDGDATHNPEVVMRIVDMMDKLDGPFVQSLRDEDLPYRGSSNQRIIDVRASLEQHEIVLWQSPMALVG